jgi:hypothetical protein
MIRVGRDRASIYLNSLLGEGMRIRMMSPLRIGRKRVKASSIHIFSISSAANGSYLISPLYGEDFTASLRSDD